VWFSEVSLRPGADMRVAIKKGLVSSRMGIVKDIAVKIAELAGELAEEEVAELSMKSAAE
jgi:hypothetical protein